MIFTTWKNKHEHNVKTFTTEKVAQAIQRLLKAQMKNSIIPIEKLDSNMLKGSPLQKSFEKSMCFGTLILHVKLP